MGYKDKLSPVIWFTGMSGAGKSTLSVLVKEYFENIGFSILVVDGDLVRGRDEKKLRYGVDDVRVNNMRIASLCVEKRQSHDAVLVPVISPYSAIRSQVRSILEPNFHLVYLSVDIVTLKDRDTKGLYSAADRGEINDLIGYSTINPYEKPAAPELVVQTDIKSINSSAADVIDYIKSILRE